jgi:hypothetical protein
LLLALLAQGLNHLIEGLLDRNKEHTGRALGKTFEPALAALRHLNWPSRWSYFAPSTCVSLSF